MLLPTVIFGILAVVLVAVGYYQGEEKHILGVTWGLNMTVKVLPLLVFALIVAGMVQMLVPQQSIADWVGQESGLKGIFIGTLAGCLTPGGPIVCFPIVVGLIQAGAGMGPTVAYITAWALWGISRIPLEIGLIGFKFIVIRVTSTLFFPPLAGIIAEYLFGDVSLK